MTPFAILHSPLCAYVGLLSVAIGFSLAMVVTEHAEQIRLQIDALLKAMEACRWSKKEFAAHLLISQARLSQVLSGERPLDVTRLWRLPAPFQIAWVRAMAANRGAMVYEAEELAFFRGLHHKPVMARMTLPQAREEQAS